MCGERILEEDGSMNNRHGEMTGSCFVEELEEDQ